MEKTKHTPSLEPSAGENRGPLWDAELAGIGNFRKNFGSTFVLLAVMALLIPVPVCAQDPFEIHVYEYETFRLGQFTLEQHLNYWAAGSKQFDGPLAPTNYQLHMTYELTGALADHVSLGIMQLNAVLPGAGFQYAGWRVLPHFYAPPSWSLPVEFGLVAECFFVHPRFIADTAHVELRPIIQRRIRDFELVFNPVFARALRGQGVGDGWTLEPAVRSPIRRRASAATGEACAWCRS